MRSRMGRVIVARLGQISGIRQERLSPVGRRRGRRALFLVCVIGDRGELYNVIPHRYVMSADGRLVHGFDGLGAAEREESCRIEELVLPSIEDMERYKELVLADFRSTCPRNIRFNPC